MSKYIRMSVYFRCCPRMLKGGFRVDCDIKLIKSRKPLAQLTILHSYKCGPHTFIENSINNKFNHKSLYHTVKNTVTFEKTLNG